ncbi:MAG: hypothetical protein EBZ28_05410, partial [Alphaproteobacteria bacterium]|nr:hypothetical protein [Alphaproteobacteria bacterium]
TRNGDPFGTITIEDYTDSFKLFLWRENYLRFKHFLTPNTFIAIRGKIEVPPRRSELEFTISSIELLQNLRETRANNLLIRNTRFINCLKTKIKNNQILHQGYFL